MGSSPSQNTASEQEWVQAIHDRARTKLKAARGSKEQQRKTYPWVGTAFSKIGYIFSALLLAPLPVWVILFAPETLDPAVWADEPVFPFSLTASLFVVLYTWLALSRRRRASTVEGVVRDFYSAASCDNGGAEILSEFIVEADLDGSQRPPPALHPDSYRPALIGAKTVARYWTYLAKPTVKRRYVFRVEDVGVSRLEPDLCLAQVKLRAVPVARQWFANLSLIIFVPLLVIFENQLPSFGTWGFFALIASVVLLQFAYTRWRSRRGDVYRVRKLLVLCGRDWRFFCADWQGYEERDLSWLDVTSPMAFQA